VTNAVEICGPNGQWGTSVTCTNQTCSGGACVGMCAPGQTNCNGTMLESCGPSGQWQGAQSCPVACCAGACVDTNTDKNNCGSCGLACAAGYACGSSISAFTGTQPGGWSANGNAVYDSADQAAQLTDLDGNEAGSWIYDNPISIDSATITFDFAIVGNGGGDGMGLVLQTNGRTMVGLDSAGLGMAGLNGFGVEIDEFNNGECLDSNSNHIGIDSLSGCNTAFPNTLVVNNNPGITVTDGNWHTIVVSVANGAIGVTADGNVLFSPPYPPTGWTSGPYYVGFAAGTGGAFNYHRVRNVHVTFATPHCY
jgi:hypothetical protein